MRKTKLTLMITLIMIVQLYNLQYVYTQLGENIIFDITTPQVKSPIKLGDSFLATQQYTIWGWFKFDGFQPSITNILNIANNKSISNENTTIGPFPNPNFPDCPLTQEQLRDSLEKDSPRIFNNPNCFPQKLDKKEIQANISTKDQDVLYVNYDLNPVDSNGIKTYSITFLVQNGRKDDKNIKDIKIDGFVDIPFKENTWSFFAISCDYSRGTANIYYKVYDGSSNNSRSKIMGLDFPSFVLKKNSELILASVERNDYFSSVSGFIGNMAYIEMSAYYTTSLQTLWVGYLNSSGYGYKGVLLEFLFNIYNKNSNKIKSYGLINNDFDISGNYIPIYTIDNNKLGVRFNPGSEMVIKDFDFLNTDLIKAFVFFFKIKYQNKLPDDYVIVERGSKGESGHIKISLVRNDENHRFIKILVRGDKNPENDFTYNSKIYFIEGEIFYVMAGIVIAPSGAARIVYLDSTKENEFPLVSDNFGFNTSPQKIVLFGNKDDPNIYKGFVDIYNFKIFNSATAAEFFRQIKSADEKSKFNFNDFCELNATYYKNALGCFECKNKVLVAGNSCSDYCPIKSKNPLTDVCVDCLNENCDEMDKTQWKVKKIDKSVYRVEPSRKVFNDNVDYENMVNLGFDKKFDYDVKTTINKEQQYIDYDFNFKDQIVNENLNFEIKNNFAKPQFDINRNLLFHQNQVTKSAVMVNTVESNICYVNPAKKNAIKGIAIALLIIFLISVAILLFMSIICRNRFHNLGSLWKFLLHTAMKLQLIAFFVLLGIYMPCCIQEFLKFIYKYAVSWDHAFKNIINDINVNSTEFQQGMLDTKPPQQFYELYIRSPILHNMGVFFIVQCAIFFIYIVLKIWDCAKTLANNFIYKTFVFLEFTALIVGYLVVHMQAFVFSSFNFKQAIFTHSYFTICFLIAICYIAVFILFWLYSLFRLLSNSNYFMNEINQNKFYYFYAGYKDSKFARTWDHWMTLCHFIVGLMIGLLYYQPLSQIIVILVFLVLLFGITIILRPWTSIWFNLAEIIMQLFIIIVVIMFLIIAAYDQNGFCVSCEGREGAICWIAVILLFLVFLIGAFVLIWETCRSAFYPEKAETLSDNSYHNEIGYEQVYHNYNGMMNEEDISQNNIMEYHKADYSIKNENIFQGNDTTHINKISNVNINENKNANISMSQFLNKMNQMNAEEDNSYISGDISYDYKTNQLQPDSIDEEYIQPNLLKTLNNSFGSGFNEMAESRNELDQGHRYVQRKKQEFYENTYKSSGLNIDDDNLNIDNPIKDWVLHSKVESGRMKYDN